MSHKCAEQLQLLRIFTTRLSEFEHKMKNKRAFMIVYRKLYQLLTGKEWIANIITYKSAGEFGRIL